MCFLGIISFNLHNALCSSKLDEVTVWVGFFFLGAQFQRDTGKLNLVAKRAFYEPRVKHPGKMVKKEMPR